ncbi:hypothetical protein MNB_SM-7-994 [hydrothermal vent metagenome]|uniref:General secretion pathway protein K n=1 Tax=hydrothermal vent metagenome TaxID=652676 RepID=A0A1W1BKD5_9ZZZZ
MRQGVALLITLVIVMLMTIVIGWSMQTLSKAKQTLNKERFMLQTGVIIEDVLDLLKNSPEIKAVADENSSIALSTLLESASMIPLETQGYRILISLKSARDRVNINTFAKNSTTQDKKRQERLANFLRSYGFGSDLYDYILDAMGGIKEDGSYRSDLFYRDPTLYRDAIVSSKQMERILLDYAKKDGVDPFSKLDFDKIFSYNEDNTTKLDLNFASAEVWEFVAGVSKERAKVLAQNGGAYEKLADIGLSQEQKSMLTLFSYSFFEPIILVHIDIQSEGNSGMIEFEYDIRKKRAKRFVFEVQK